MSSDPAAAIDLQLRLAGSGVPTVDATAPSNNRTSTDSPYDADEAAWIGWSGAAGLAAPAR